jgi:hypothetical protein
MKELMKYLLAGGLIAILTVSVADAQNIQMKKWVFGSGGMIGEKNSDGIQMSGILGQIAIEKVSPTNEANPYDIYQGFWTPDGESGTDVPEDQNIANLRNFPNPFSSQTTIEFTLPGLSHTTLVIYSTTGQKIRTYDLGIIDGTMSITWDAKDDGGFDVGSGSYVLELSAEPAIASGALFNSFKSRSISVLVK